jgi:hypothetical protein
MDTSLRAPEESGSSSGLEVRGTLAKVGTPLVLLGGMVAAIAMLAGDRLRAWYADPFRDTPLPVVSSPIPQLIGRTVDLPRVDERGRPIPLNQPLVLAPAPCGSCAGPEPWVESLQRTGKAPVVALLAWSDPDIQRALDKNAGRTFYVHLPHANRLASLLDEIAPLFAATDGERRIVAVSAPSESAYDFARRVGVR